MRGRALCCICLPLLLFIALIGLLAKDEDLSSSLPIREGQTVKISGTVYKQDIQSTYQSLYLKDISIASDEAHFLPDTNVKVYLKENKEIATGCHIHMTGELFYPQPATNPGGFDQKTYYGSQGIGLLLKKASVIQTDGKLWPIRNALTHLQQSFVKVMSRVAPKEDAGILCAMLFGWRGALQSEVKDLYQDVGLIHLLSISGLHITLLGSAIYKILRKLGLLPSVAGILAMAVLGAYAVMTGLAYPALRAVIMFAFYLTAKVTGRTYDMPTALAAAAMVMLLGESRSITQAGFLLSFAAVAGILLSGHLTLGKRGGNIGVNLGIQAMTLPLTAYFYYRIPLCSLVLNFPIVPLMPVIFGSAFAGCAAGLLWPAAGEMFMAPAHYCLRLIQFLGDKVQLLPLASIVPGKPPFFLVVVYYPALLAGYHFLRRKVLIKLGFTIILLSGIFCFPKGKTFTVTFLDVGQGDGICMEHTDGSVWMIDGGSSSETDITRYCLEPFLESKGISRVSGWFVSHYDADHVSGLLELLRSYKPNLLGNNSAGITIESIFLPNIQEESEIKEEIVELAGKNHISIRVVEKDDVLQAGTMKIRVLAPERDTVYTTGNAASSVLWVTYGNFHMLLTGDLEADGEERLLASGILQDIDVLKVAHHGSNHSTGAELLQAITPEVAVISCGKDNSYGHPGEVLLKRLRDAGCSIARTDRQGAVSVKVKKNGIYSVTEMISGEWGM